MQPTMRPSLLGDEIAVRLVGEVLEDLRSQLVRTVAGSPRAKTGDRRWCSDSTRVEVEQRVDVVAAVASRTPLGPRLAAGDLRIP